MRCLIVLVLLISTADAQLVRVTSEVFERLDS